MYLASLTRYSATAVLRGGIVHSLDPQVNCGRVGSKHTYRLVIVAGEHRSVDIVRACSMFYPDEGYRSVTPLDAARVNSTIFHDHSVH